MNVIMILDVHSSYWSFFEIFWYFKYIFYQSIIKSMNVYVVHNLYFAFIPMFKKSVLILLKLYYSSNSRIQQM